MERTELKGLIEALIFASDAPLTTDKIKQIIENITKKEIDEIISELHKDYEHPEHGFHLREVANGYQFRTKPAFAFWLKRLKKTKPFRLTQPTLETLAIIAYKQPITKLEIEKIRGVDSGGVIKTLLERKLICISGRKNIPGRPFLLSTTKTFLEIFGLENLSSLPSIKELEDLDDVNLPSILSDRMTKNIRHEESSDAAIGKEENKLEGQGCQNDNIHEDQQPVAFKEHEDENHAAG